MSEMRARRPLRHALIDEARPTLARGDGGPATESTPTHRRLIGLDLDTVEGRDKPFYYVVGPT